MAEVNTENEGSKFRGTLINVKSRVKFKCSSLTIIQPPACKITQTVTDSRPFREVTPRGQQCVIP
jgi:hypothetical protein